MSTSTPLRLALRVEGNWWVAYIATTENMEGAIELARIRLGALKDVAGGTDRWKSLMVDILGTQLKGIGLPPISWDEHAAPESERSGKA